MMTSLVKSFRIRSWPLCFVARQKIDRNEVCFAQWNREVAALFQRQSMKLSVRIGRRGASI